MSAAQVNGEQPGTSSTQEHNERSHCTLLSLLTQWSNPSDPCVASRRVLEVIRSQQVLPLWSPEGGELLLKHVAQAVKSKSPGILSLLELLQEYARFQQLQEDEEEEDEEEEEGRESSITPYVVKGYALLCLFLTGEVTEGDIGDGGGGGEGQFDCMDFVRRLTFFFKMLLECSRASVLRHACLVGRSQLRVVVDGRLAIFQRRNVLKDLNELLIQMNSAGRYVFRQECDALFMKVPRLLEEVGDYDLQASLVELIYRMTSSADRKRYITRCFPELDCTIQSLFLTITEFDPHCRRFLNAYNSSLGSHRKVHTIPCHEAFIGRLRLCKPKSQSYPMFWVDFNLGYPSVLVTCQLEGQAEVNNLWECLFLIPEEVQHVTLTRHMHTYTLEIEYSSVEEVEDLFSSPLSRESRALLSNVVFFEFSPLQILEEVCTHIFRSKLMVINLEPKGWKLNEQGKSAAHNGVAARPMTSTQSTITASQKKKTSAVSIECEEYEVVEELQSKLIINGPTKPHKPASSTRRRKGSEVLLDMELSDMAETGDREANRTLPIDDDNEPAHQKTSKGKGNVKTSTRGKQSKGKPGLVRCSTSSSPHSSQVSPHFYKPLNFTSPRPGAAVLRDRTPRKGKTSGKDTDVTCNEEDEDQPTPTIKRNKHQSTKPGSKEGEMQKPAQPDLKHKVQQEEAVEEVSVILPSSEESLVMAKITKKATTAANASSAHGVHSEAWNAEWDPGSHANVTETPPCVEEKTKASPCIRNKTKAPPSHLTKMKTHSYMKHKMKTPSCSENKMETNNFSGFNDSGIYTEPSDRQTSTTVEKESKGMKKGTRRSSFRNELVTNNTQVEQEARVVKKQTSKRPSQELKSVNDVPSKGNIKDKAGSTKDAETSPTSPAILSRTPDKADPTQIEEKNVTSQEADLASNMKSNIVKLNEVEAVQLIVSESPEVEPHLKLLSHAQNKEYSAKTIITSHTHDMPECTKPTETGSLQVKSHTSQPVSHAHDKHDYMKPDTSPALATDNELRHETHTEEDTVHSNLALLKESPIPSGQVYDKELFDSDPIDEDTEDTTQPFVEPVVIAPVTALVMAPVTALVMAPVTAPAIAPVIAPVTTPAQSPSPSPQDKQLPATGSFVPKDVGGRCTSPHTPQETTQMEFSKHKPVPKTAQPPSQQKESVQAAASDTQNLSPIMGDLEKLKMSPFLNLAMVEVVTYPQYIDAPGAMNSGPQAAPGEGEETSVMGMDRQVEENAEVSVMERDTQVKENADETSIGSEKMQHRPEEVTSLKKEDKLVEESADKTSSRSVTSGLSENSNVSNNGPELMTQNVLDFDSICEDIKRSSDKSVMKKLESPLLDHQEQHAKKGTPHKSNRGRKRTTRNARGKEQQMSYPALISQRAASPINRLSTTRIRNKRKLFDPSAQSSVVVSPPQPHVEEKRQKTLETNQNKANISTTASGEFKNNSGDSLLQYDMNKMTNKMETHSSGKKRRVSRDKSNDQGSSGGKAKSVSKPPPRRASGFLEESGADEEPHSIYSDLESSPNKQVDVWFLHRIEKIKHHKVTYSNTSSRRLSLKEEREHTVNKRKYSTEDDKNNSNNTSSDIEGLSHDNRFRNPPKSPLSGFTTSKDTSENSHTYSLPIDSPKRKGRNRESSSALVLKSTSTSEVSQTSSHDEWEPPSSKKKKSLSKKEDTKHARSRRRTEKKQICSKDGNSLDDSLIQMNTKTFTSSSILADHSDLHESSAEALRHTSRSSVDSGTSNFVNFKLAAPKGKATRMENARTEGEVDARYPSALPQTSKPFSPEPQKSEPQVSSPVQESPATQVSTPVLFLESPALQVLSLPPQEDSPSQELELSIPHATDNQQNDIETSQLELQDNQVPSTHHSTSTFDPKTTQVTVTTAAALAQASTQPFRAGSTPQSPQYPSHLSSMDISAILIPGSDTQAPPSGPLQSTMLDSLLGKTTSPAPKFSYVSEAEASYIEKEHGVRGKDSASHKSPSSNDPVKAELRYDRDQTPSLVTITTTAEVHQADTALDEPVNHSSIVSPRQTQTPGRNQQIETPSHPSEAFRNEVREQERPQTNPPRVQPSLIQPVAPTAKVPPQSASSGFSSRKYRQLLQTPQQTPLSRHESPVHPQSRNLFGAVRGGAAVGEERRSLGGHDGHRMDMMAAVLAVQADLERVSGSFYRLAHTLGTALTLFAEHCSNGEIP